MTVLVAEVERDYFSWLSWLSCGDDAMRLRAEASMVNLNAEDFADQRHSTAYELAQAIVDEGEAINLHSVCRRVRSGQADAYGGDEYLVNLFGGQPRGMAPANVEMAARAIASQAVRRQREELSARAHAAVQAGNQQEAQDLWDEAAWLETPAEADTLTWTDLIRGRLMAHMEASSANAQGSGRIMLGFPALDRELSGIDPATMLIVGGRPGDGKSSLTAIAFAKRWAAQGVRVGIVSGEDGAEVMGQRVAAAATGIDSGLFRGSRLLPDEATKRLDKAQADQKLGRIAIEFAIGATIDRLRQAIVRLVRRHHAQVVVVDYAQAFRVPGAERRIEVREVARQSKSLCARLGVPLVLCSQLRRFEGKRPEMQHLREAGDLEEMADVVLLLWREHPYRYAWIAKNKNGPPGAEYRLDWDDVTATVRDVVRIGAGEFSDREEVE